MLRRAALAQPHCTRSSHRTSPALLHCRTLQLKTSRPYVRSPFLTPVGISCLLGVGVASYAAWLLSSGIANKPASLSPDYFISADIVAVDDTGPDSKLISLKLPPSAVPRSLSADTILSIYIKDDDIQIERPFTPLEGLGADGTMTFWVKRYADSEVGQWLHRKRTGDRVDVRGLCPTWSWKGQSWDKVILISGGTGITPFHQLLHHVFEDRDSGLPESLSFSLLHSSRSPGELPPGIIMDKLTSWVEKKCAKLAIRIFVDRSERIGNFKVGRISRDDILHELQDSSVELSKVLFLVCGPEPMISAIAGPRAKNQMQGQIGGILGSLGCTPDQVYKL